MFRHIFAYIYITIYSSRIIIHTYKYRKIPGRSGGAEGSRGLVLTIESIAKIETRLAAIGWNWQRLAGIGSDWLELAAIGWN